MEGLGVSGGILRGWESGERRGKGSVLIFDEEDAEEVDEEGSWGPLVSNHGFMGNYLDSGQLRAYRCGNRGRRGA